MTGTGRRRHRDVPGRATVLVFTTRRRLDEQRMYRTRTVYISACRIVDMAGDDDLDALSEPSPRHRWSRRKGRYGRLNGPARAPLGGVVLRPVGDALTTVQVLRTT